MARGGCGKDQFVVVAAREVTVTFKSRCRQDGVSRSSRVNGDGEFQGCRNLGGFQHVTEVGEQAVGNVDGSRRESPQRQPERYARLRTVQGSQAIR